MALQKEYILPLELYGKSKRPDIEYVQGDTNVYPLYFLLQEHGKPYDLTTVTNLTLTIRRPNKKVVVGEVQIIDPEYGSCFYNFVGNELGVAGECVCQVQAYAPDGKRLTWQDFTFLVRKQLDQGEAIPSQPEYPILLSLIKEVQELEENGGGGGVSRGYVDTQDAATLQLSKDYSTAQDTTVLQSANAYADQQDAATLEAAKAYTDEHAAEVAVGTVTTTTLDAGSSATVEVAKSETGLDFSFGIPRGIPGIQGNPGEGVQRFYRELKLWRSRIAHAYAGKLDKTVRVAIIGDSFSAGANLWQEHTMTYASRLNEMLCDRFGWDYDYGVIDTSAGSHTVSFTPASSWEIVEEYPLSRFVVANTTGATMNFKIKGVGLDVLYLKTPLSGSMVITIDGINQQSINLYGSAYATFDKVSYSGLTNKEHEVTITHTVPTDGRNCAYLFRPQYGTPRIVVDNYAISGSRTTDWNTALNRQIIEFSEADLTILLLGGNDMKTDKSVDAYGTRMQELIRYIKNTGSEIFGFAQACAVEGVLPVLPEGSNALYNDFMDKFEEVCGEEGVAFANFLPRWGAGREYVEEDFLALDFNLYTTIGDPQHTNEAGMCDMAYALSEYLLPQAQASQKALIDLLRSITGGV